MSTFINSNSHVFKFIFALILLCLQEASLVSSMANLEKVTVHVKNKIAPGRDLDVHCRSKSDNMGLHKLHYMEQYEWTFKVNFWGTTLYWCSFQFHNDQKQLVHASFDIFKFNRDRDRCFRHCYWEIKKGGAYFVDADGKRSEIMYTWPGIPKPQDSPASIQEMVPNEVIPSDADKST